MARLNCPEGGGTPLDNESTLVFETDGAALRSWAPTSKLRILDAARQLVALFGRIGNESGNFRPAGENIEGRRDGIAAGRVCGDFREWMGEGSKICSRRLQRQRREKISANNAK